MRKTTLQKLADLRVLLWSPTQKAFQEQAYAEMQKMNLKAFAKGTKSDWILLTIGTDREVDAFRNALEDAERNQRTISPQRKGKRALR